jgi:hypothetical protein
MATDIFRLCESVGWVVNLERPADAVPRCVSPDSTKSSQEAVSGESSNEVGEIL